MGLLLSESLYMCVYFNGVGMRKLFNCIRTVEAASLSSAKKYYEENEEFFDKGFFDYLVKLDTTPNKKYVEGFLKMFKNEVQDQENPRIFCNRNLDAIGVFCGKDGSISRRYGGDALIRADKLDQHFHNYLKAVQAKKMNPDLSAYDLDSFIESVEDYVRSLENKEYAHLLDGGIYNVLKKFKEGKDYELREDNENFIATVPLNFEFSSEFAGPKAHWCVCRNEGNWDDYREQGTMFVFVFDKTTELLYMVEVDSDDEGGEVYYWTWKNDSREDIDGFPVDEFDPGSDYAVNNLPHPPPRVYVVENRDIAKFFGWNFVPEFLSELDLIKLVYYCTRSRFAHKSDAVYYGDNRWVSSFSNSNENLFSEPPLTLSQLLDFPKSRLVTFKVIPMDWDSYGVVNPDEIFQLAQDYISELFVKMNKEFFEVDVPKFIIDRAEQSDYSEEAHFIKKNNLSPEDLDGLISKLMERYFKGSFSVKTEVKNYFGFPVFKYKNMSESDSPYFEAIDGMEDYIYFDGEDYWTERIDSFLVGLLEKVKGQS